MQVFGRPSSLQDVILRAESRRALELEVSSRMHLRLGLPSLRCPSPSWFKNPGGRPTHLNGARHLPSGPRIITE